MKAKIGMSVVCLILAVMPALIAQNGKTRAARADTIFVRSGGGSYLGVGVADIGHERAQALHLKEERGVEIKSVAENSPAAKAGLKERDVVLEYNGEKVEGMEQFMRMVRETPPGRQCSLSVWRNGAVQSLTVTMGRRNRGAMMRPGAKDFSFEIPAMPAMPRLPDMSGLMAWRSTMLGVNSESLTPQLAGFFGVKDGVLVRSVIKNSAAEKAGIKAGDVITAVNGTKVKSPQEISNVLRGLRPPKTIPVVVVRRQQEMTLNVTLENTHGPQREFPDRAWLPDYEAQ